MQKKIKIAYITWGETPRTYGVFGSQVIQQLSRISKNYKTTVDLHFLSFLPFIHSGFVREKIGYFNEIKKIKSILSGIQFKIFFLPIPQNLVNPTRLTHRFLFLWGLRKLKSYIEKNDIHIVHCRSIHAAYAACLVKDRSDKKFAIVFDIRSPWPETIALQRHHNQDHPEYRYFKSIEKFIVNSCDSLVSVSTTMSAYYEKTYAKKCELIYLSAPVEIFKNENSNEKAVDRLHLLYVGALAEEGWHKISELILLLQRINLLFPDCAITIVTTSPHNSIRSKLKEAGLNSVKLVSAFSVNELKFYLHQANIACLTVFTPRTELERIFCANVFAVKSVEYLSAGLPILCNKFLGGAAAYVEEHKLGLLYDPNNFDTLKREDIKKLINRKIKEDAIAQSCQDFSYDSNARKYYNLYQSLAEKITINDSNEKLHR